MTLKQEIFHLASSVVIKGLRLNYANKVLCKFAEKVEPAYRVKYRDRTYTFSCPNDLTRWRAMTFLTKEPETLEWIDTFVPGDILFDIGANVGLYSIYAASRGVQCFSFEPESQNYALLNRNVFLNRLQDRITCLNLALSDSDRLDFLYLPQFMAGGALNNFGEAKDFKHRDFVPAFKQAVVSYALDSFLERFPEKFPNHIKVDVDGLEAKIIAGATKTLRDSRMKSLLIEINEALPTDLAVCERIQGLGYKISHKKHAPMAAQGEFATVLNYVFIRA